jgi:hypothetical protein
MANSQAQRLPVDPEYREMNTSQWIEAVTSILTALGVLFAGVQLLLQKRQATTHVVSLNSVTFFL